MSTVADDVGIERCFRQLKVAGITRVDKTRSLVDLFGASATQRRVPLHLRRIGVIDVAYETRPTCRATAYEMLLSRRPITSELRGRPLRGAHGAF